MLGIMIACRMWYKHAAAVAAAAVFDSTNEWHIVVAVVVAFVLAIVVAVVAIVVVDFFKCESSRVAFGRVINLNSSKMLLFLP